MSANYVTDCVQHVSFYLRLYLQLLKTPLCKNLGVKKLLDFAGKRPWLQARRQQLPAIKSYLELWVIGGDGARGSDWRRAQGHHLHLIDKIF